MASNNNRKRIAVLFKEEVRTLDDKNIAGCERVFLDDIFFLKSRNLLSGAYMAAKNLGKESKYTSFIHTIVYPHHLLDKLQMLLERLPILRRLGHTFFKIFKLIIQLCYACAFIIKEFKSDVFYVIQVPLVGLFFPKKTTIFYHNFYHDLDYIFNTLYLLQKNAKQIKFVFVSQSLLDQFINEYPIIKQNKCFVLKNSVDLNIFTPKNKSTDKISFIYLSAWVEEKGVYLLPEIIERINAKHINKVSFIIGGSTGLWSLSDEDYKKYVGIKRVIYNLAKKFSNVNIVDMVSRREIPKLLSSATFTLLPSVWQEPNSLLAKESLACGTPVISFDVGGNKEIISNHKDGYLVKENGVEAYIKLLDKLISRFDNDKYKIMSQNASVNSHRYPPSRRYQELSKILFS